MRPMPQFDTSFWIQLLVYAVTFAATWGSVTQRIKALEAKVDKHNNVVERMAVAERDLKSAWRAIDEIKDDIREDK